MALLESVLFTKQQNFRLAQIQSIETRQQIQYEKNDGICLIGELTFWEYEKMLPEFSLFVTMFSVFLWP